MLDVTRNNAVESAYIYIGYLYFKYAVLSSLVSAFIKSIVYSSIYIINHTSTMQREKDIDQYIYIEIKCLKGSEAIQKKTTSLSKSVKKFSH